MPQIEFSVEFDGEENLVHVTIHKAVDIPAADVSGNTNTIINGQYLSVPYVRENKKITEYIRWWEHVCLCACD